MGSFPKLMEGIPSLKDITLTGDYLFFKSHDHKNCGRDSATVWPFTFTIPERLRGIRMVVYLDDNQSEVEIHSTENLGFLIKSEHTPVQSLGFE